MAVKDRHILMALAIGLVGAICLNRLADGGGLWRVFVLTDRAGAGLGEWLALAALFSVILRYGDEARLSRGELLAFDARLSSIGQLLLALVFFEWLGRWLFALVSPWVLNAETSAVTGLLSLFGGDFAREGNQTIRSASGFGIEVAMPCSAFHNLSFATLVWISLIKLERLEVRRFDWLVLGALAAATIGLNTMRIALMAQSYSSWDYWHNGTGKTICAVTMLAAMLIIFQGGRFQGERYGVSRFNLSAPRRMRVPSLRGP